MAAHAPAKGGAPQYGSSGDSLGAKIARRAGELKTNRYTVEDVWRQCYDVTYPMRGVDLALKSVSGQGPDINIGYGKDKRADLLDSTATDSARLLSSANVSGLHPSNARWFGLDVGTESQAEQKWLDAAATLLWENIHASNFDAVAFECMLDFVIAGMFVMFIDEDRERGGLIFEEWPLAQCYFAASKPGGVIDTVYRCFSLTAEQAVAEYGEENLSDQIAKNAGDKPDTPHGFIHAVYPRKPYAVGARLAKNLPVASCHVETATKKVVRESGFHEMPVVVPRWTLIPGSHLAVGPVFDALPDVKTLNKVVEFDLSNADMAVAGMWGVVDDGVLNTRTVRIGPRKLITMASKDSMFPLTPGGDPNIANDKIARLQGSVRKTLMSDQLMPQPDTPQMTATEVVVRLELLRQLLGPVFGRMQAEYLRGVVERCFGLAYRAGIFPPPPKALAGREFTVKYMSPLARAQKATDITAMDRFEADLAATSRIKPDVLDLYDWDGAKRDKAEKLGVPLEHIRDPQAVEALREDRAKQQQAAASANAAGQAVAAAAGGKPDGAGLGQALGAMAAA